MTVAARIAAKSARGFFRRHHALLRKLTLDRRDLRRA